jgi:hypothetical protein
MKHEISLNTLVMAKRALEELTQWHLEKAVKDMDEFNRTADLRKRAYKATSQLDVATYSFLLLTKLEITDGTEIK